MTPNTTVTLYAAWQKLPTYKVVYNLNEGTGSVPIDLNDYFLKYENLKSLTLESMDSFKISNDKNNNFGFIFPPKLKYIHLIYFHDAIIIPLL